MKLYFVFIYFEKIVGIKVERAKINNIKSKLPKQSEYLRNDFDKSEHQMCLSEPSGREMITCLCAFLWTEGEEKKDLSSLQRLLEWRDCFEFLNEPSDGSQVKHLPCVQLTVCGVFS